MYNPNRDLLESVKSDLLKYSTPDFISNFPHIINEIKEKNDKFKNCDGIVKDALYDYIKNQKYQFELRDKKPVKERSVKISKIVIDKKYKRTYKNIKKNISIEIQPNNKIKDFKKPPIINNQNEPNNNNNIDKPNENISDDIDLMATAQNLFRQINKNATLINEVIATNEITTKENETYLNNILNQLKICNNQLTNPEQKLSTTEIDYINSKLKVLERMYNLYNNITKADKLENISNIAKANESASRSFAVLLQASSMQEEKQMQIDSLKKLENIDNGTIDDINNKINELLISDE